MNNLIFRTLIITFLIVNLLGCNGNTEFTKRLSILDSMLIEHPDSTYRALCRLETEVPKQCQENRMYYELLRADAQNRSGIDFTSDSTMLKITKYYDDNGTPNEQMRAHFLLGCVYRDMKDVPMELQCFLEATKKADTSSNDCDLHTLISIYSQMANIYNKQHLHEEELKMLALCEKYAIKNNEMLSAINAYTLRLRSFEYLNMYDSVLVISENARKRYLNLGKIPEAARMLIPAISILIDRGEYENAKKYLNIYKSESNDLKDNEIINPSTYTHYKILGKYALYENKIDSARYYFYKLLEKEKYEDAYEGLLSLSEKTNNTDSILKYGRLYYHAKDSSLQANNALAIAQMTVMFDYKHQKKIAQASVQEKKSAITTNAFLLYFLNALVVISLCASIFYYYRNKERNRQQQILFKRYNDLKAYANEIEIEKERIKDVESQNIEHMAKLKLLQNELASSKREIDNLSLQLDNIKNTKAIIDFDTWLTNFKSNKIIEKLWTKAITAKPDSTLPTLILMELQKHYKQNCPQFYQMLISPIYDLNDMDRKVIMLNICDFTTGDIANILGKTPQQISNTNNRIKNKIFPSLTKTNLLKKNLLNMLQDSLHNTR